MSRRNTLVVVLLIAAATLAAVLIMTNGRSLAGEPAQISDSDAYWWWDRATPVGSTRLVRNSSGLTAVYDATDLPAGQALTLWFIIFNSPENCATSPCSIPQDVFNPDAAADFYFGAGHVVGGSGNTSFGGRLQVGDLTGSGKAETGLADPVALTNPYGAEVVLALHSHGPALTGQALQDQISSYLGGCVVFNGPDGFAAGPEDVPDAVGECSTITYSLHQSN